MATYKNRNVKIIRQVPTPDIQYEVHTEDGSKEVIPEGQLVFTKEEADMFAKHDVSVEKKVEKKDEAVKPVESQPAKVDQNKQKPLLQK